MYLGYNQSIQVKEREDVLVKEAKNVINKTK